MSRTTWIVFIVLCVGVLGELVVLSRGQQVNVSDVNTDAVQAATADNGEIADHVFGSSNPKVTIIEYGDYECPACGTAAPIMKKIANDYEDKGVRFIFRNYPLTTIHPNAQAAAAAAESAGLQGKFWEMHDKLYSNQSAWEYLSATDRTDMFVSYASSLGLNADTFKNDLSSDAISKKITFDTKLAEKAGATGTPTIVVNGINISATRVENNKAVANSSDTSLPFVWAKEDTMLDLIIKPALDKANS